MNDKELASTVAVQEGDNVKLPCIAEGSPPPKFSWRRDDKKAIRVGSWSQSAVEGGTLNISRVRREHMGTYICAANNGVPPTAYHRVSMEVTCKHCVLSIALSSDECTLLPSLADN